jgi:anti-sigma regulatory factor (Ser/Thr protein kinase)
MGCRTPPQRLRLPTDLTAPKSARDFLDQNLCAAHGARPDDLTRLLVSELVTNAVRHGAPPIEIAVRCVGSATLQISVSDGSPARPVQREAQPRDEGGRGIALVDLISDDWGVADRGGAGKAVWFTLRT